MKANSTEKIAVAVIRFLLNVIYRFCCLRKRRKLAIFITRQSDLPSYNFQEIASRARKDNFETRFLCTKLNRKNIFKYAIHAVRSVNALARCEVCYLERYDPIVSFIKFLNSDKNLTYPDRPIIVQLWHAFGVFKKFGYQCVDTSEGHSSEVMKLYRIHENYTYALCSSKACRAPFAKAFNIDISRVIPCPLPELDRLVSVNKAAENVENSMPHILIAPSLRNNAASPHPLKDMYLSGKWKDSLASYEVLWFFHPLESKSDSLGSSRELLLKSDIVITDYSSLVYEAYLLNKKVIFYCPDIEVYRKSPGLNSDPLITCPSISFTKDEDLFSFINQLNANEISYPYQELSEFCKPAFDAPSNNPACGQYSKLISDLHLS